MDGSEKSDYQAYIVSVCLPTPVQDPIWNLEIGIWNLEFVTWNR